MKKIFNSLKPWNNVHSEVRPTHIHTEQYFLPLQSNESVSGRNTLGKSSVHDKNKQCMKKSFNQVQYSIIIDRLLCGWFFENSNRLFGFYKQRYSIPDIGGLVLRVHTWGFKNNERSHIAWLNSGIMNIISFSELEADFLGCDTCHASKSHTYKPTQLLYNLGNFKTRPT